MQPRVVGPEREVTLFMVAQTIGQPSLSVNLKSPDRLVTAFIRVGAADSSFRSSIQPNPRGHHPAPASNADAGLVELPRRGVQCPESFPTKSSASPQASLSSSSSPHFPRRTSPEIFLDAESKRACGGESRVARLRRAGCVRNDGWGGSAYVGALSDRNRNLRSRLRVN